MRVPTFLLLLTLAFIPEAAQAAPPANDAFVNRIALSGNFPITTSGTNVEATKQGGEYNHAGYTGGKSVWWTWTAPARGLYTLRTDGSSFDTLVAVYTGTAVNSLTLIASDNDAGAGNNSLVTFEATAGTTYQVVVDGYAGFSGSITLTIDPPILAPENDNFANRISLGSGAASVNGHNRLCTQESGEPVHAGFNGGKSVWYTWTAPSSGECTLLVSNVSISLTRSVYTGTAVNALTQVVGQYGWEPIKFMAIAGTVYQLAVDSGYGESGTFTLSISNPIPPPANDNFVNAAVVSTVPTAIAASNQGASREAGEPEIHGSYPGGKSVWWKWTAPSTGECYIWVANSNYVSTSAIYTGTAVNALTVEPVATGWQPLDAIAGTTYYIAVDGKDATSGTFTLHFGEIYPAPANDNFADRIVLPASGANVSATSYGASLEVGEPKHGGNGNDISTWSGTIEPGLGGRSLWWSWTSPSSGEVVLTVDNRFSAEMSIYTGSSLDALNLVSGRSWVGGTSFNAVAGTTYQIALDSSDGNPYTFSLRLDDPIPAASNDNFAGRMTLTSTAAKAAGSNQGATKEPGEPNHADNLGGRSVWFSWTAPSTGTFYACVMPEFFNYHLLSVHTGASVSSLTPVASAKGWGGSYQEGVYFPPLGMPFSATAGTTYHIAVDGFFNGAFALSGRFALDILPPPANENFAAAIDLGMDSNATSTSYVDYTGGTEAGEPGTPPPFPYPPPNPHTIWWKWTAPTSGFFVFHTLGADFDTVLQIYTGSAVNALTLAKENHDADDQGRSSLALNATAGTVYHIRVSGETPGDVGTVPLTLMALDTPVTADDYVTLGRAYLQQQTDAGVTSADASFTAALALDANHPEANLFKAFTTFAMLEQGAAFQNVLTTLGITDSTVQQLRYTIRKNAQGDRQPLAATGNTAVAINYLGDTVLPALAIVRAHLDKVTSPTYLLAISDTETGDRLELIDQGDLSLIRAATHGIEAMVRLLQTYNAGVDVATAITAANNDQLTVENVAASFTNLLTFTGNDQRAAFKTALQSANAHYQTGSAFVRNTRSNKRDEHHLFHLDGKGDAIEEEIRENLQSTSNSLNGATPVGGEIVNLAQAITSPQSLREQLFGLVGNKGIASTVPDPTFGGVVPNSSQAKVNCFLRRTGFLHEITNFSNWAAAFLGGQSAPNQAKSADPDKDMLSNFAEYAFNLNPGRSSATQEYAVSGLQTNVSDGKKYLNLSFVRRIDRATIDYVVAVSDNLTTWDRTGTQLQQVGAATANADGVTETVAVRLLVDPLVTSRKFVRLEVSELAP